MTARNPLEGWADRRKAERIERLKARQKRYADMNAAATASLLHAAARTQMHLANLAAQNGFVIHRNPPREGEDA